MKDRILTAIKVVSILLITGAIGLELWNISAELTHTQPPQLPSIILIFSRLILIAHAIEGAIAAVYAPTKKKRFLPYSIYTFFVGTVGLLELFDREASDRRKRLPNTSTES